MKKIIILLLSVISIMLFSQKEIEANNLIVLNEAVGKLTIEEYKNVELHKNEKCNYLDISVEQKFCNFFNLNNKEELTNFFKPLNIPSSYSKEDYIDKMKIYDNGKNNFYELDSKYIFDYGISKDVFIKYVNHNEVFHKSLYSTIYIQEFNNKIRIKEMGENFDIGMFLISSNTDKTINYLNKSTSQIINISSFCNQLLDNVKSKNNKNDLYNLLDKKYSPFFNEKTTNDNELTKNTSQNVFTYNYKKEFHDIISGFVLKKNVNSKKEISEKYKIPLETLSKDSLSVKEVISINTLNNDFTIIKFYDSKPIIKTDFEVLKNDISNYNNTLKVLLKLNFEFFITLYSDENNKKFPEANQIKSLIKNTNGELDISKLVQIIEKNKKELSKY